MTAPQQTGKTIPLVDLKVQYHNLGSPIDAAISRVLQRCDFILGKDVRLFETEFAAYCEVPHAVGVGSGTDALHLACRALGIGPGDEVIVPAMTFASTAFGVSLTGAWPVLVDVRSEDALIDPARIEDAISSRTRAIIPVHLYGRCADMDAIQSIASRHGLAVIEDAAQAHGATWQGRRAGGLGDIGCFSFYPGKNLGAYGDGGMVTTRRSDIAQRVAMLRNCGSLQKYHHDDIGLNSRLDTVQAAILRVKLKFLDEWNGERRRRAMYYTRALESAGCQCMPAGEGSVWHLYVVRVRGRDRVLSSLQAQGIGAGIHYPFAIHELKAYRALGYGTGEFPVAEQWARRSLSLPLYPELSHDDMDRCIAALKTAVAQVEDAP